MKILALSDVHGDTAFMRKMAERGVQEKVDLVILAGDLLNFDEPTEGLIRPFIEKGLEVAVIPGNHEGMAEIGFMVDKYGVKNLHGYTMIKGDVGIFGCGYGDIGLHQLTDDDFFNTLQQAHNSMKNVKKKVMVTHIQPNDSILSLHNPNWGSSGVRKAIEEFQPDVHICGHIHETHGIEDRIGKTRSINVGKKGIIVEV